MRICATALPMCSAVSSAATMSDGRWYAGLGFGGLHHAQLLKFKLPLSMNYK